MLRSILAVLSAPVVYGLVCVPANWLVVKLFPTHFDENWLTSHTGVLALLVSLTVVFAAASGFVGAWIAQETAWACAIAICVLQLGIGIAVQRQYWNVLPLWYHLTFFALLIVGVIIGARLCIATGIAPQNGSAASISQVQID